MSLYDLFVITSSLGIAYLFSSIVYRIFFHPLSKYPGPVLGKLTALHTTYHAYKGDRYLHLYQLHKKYGPVVRYAPNALSFNSSTALQQIYGHGAQSRKFQKSEFYKGFVAVKGVHNTHNAIDKKVHARKRRVLSAAFGENALRGMEGDMLVHIGEAMELIEKGKDGMDVGEVMSWLAFDVMGEFSFGKTFGMLRDESTRFVTGMIEMAATMHYICGNYLLLKSLNIARIAFPEITTTRWKYILHSRACADERMKLHADGLDADKRDFFHYLLDAADASKASGNEQDVLSKPELWGEANVLMIAGSDTTATALTATLYFLAHHPEIQAELRKELRGLFGSATEITGHNNIGQAVFLKATIEEAMRIAPSVPGLLPRECIAEGATIDGHSVPLGTVVGVPIWTIHHNPTYFPQPFKFDPSRFLSSPDSETDSTVPTTTTTTRADRSAYSPFSIGARACLGKSMAMNELRLTIGRIIFDWEVKPVIVPGKYTETGWNREWLREKRLFLSGEAHSKGGDEQSLGDELPMADGFTSRKPEVWVRFEKVV